MERKIFVIVALFVFALVSACSSNKNASVVQADANTDVDLANYKSYTFATQVDNELDPGFYFLNDLAAKSQIREAMQYELNTRGYNKAADGDMVVNFRVFDKPTEITGFSGLGDNYWDGASVTAPQDNRTYKVDAGTLMVHLIDKKTGNLLWQGFASGIMDGNAIVKDKAKIQQAVSSIFDQFVRDNNIGGNR